MRNADGVFLLGEDFKVFRQLGVEGLASCIEGDIYWHGRVNSSSQRKLSCCIWINLDSFSVIFFFIWPEIILQNDSNLFPFTALKTKSDQNAVNPVSHRITNCIKEKWNLLLALPLGLAFRTKTLVQRKQNMEFIIKWNVFSLLLVWFYFIVERAWPLGLNFSKLTSHLCFC